MHIISDLFLGFNEFSLEEEIIPEVDLVILNGNLGALKRGMLYAEKICRKHPNIEFIFNPGDTEAHHSVPKTLNEMEESLRIRQQSSPTWPKNLHYNTNNIILQLQTGEKVDVLCLYGYPKIHDVSVPWEETVWFQYHVSELVHSFTGNKYYGKPLETTSAEICWHGWYPVFATKEWINEQHEIELQKVKTWELTDNGCRKILVTHINPYKDKRCLNQVVTPYLIHLNNGTWVTSNVPVNGVQFLGSKLYSNPGRGVEARGKIVSVQ